MFCSPQSVIRQRKVPMIFWHASVLVSFVSSVSKPLGCATRAHSGAGQRVSNAISAACPGQMVQRIAQHPTDRVPPRGSKHMIKDQCASDGCPSAASPNSQRSEWMRDSAGFEWGLVEGDQSQKKRAQRCWTRWSWGAIVGFCSNTTWNATLWKRPQHGQPKCGD